MLRKCATNVVIIAKNALINMIVSSAFLNLNTNLIQKSKNNASKVVAQICMLIANNIVKIVVKIVTNVLMIKTVPNVLQDRFFLVYYIIINTNLYFFENSTLLTLKLVKKILQ